MVLGTRAWRRLPEPALWGSQTRAIQGKFGSGVGSYVSFWREVVTADAWVALVFCTFVVAPRVLTQRPPPDPDADIHGLFPGSNATSPSLMLQEMQVHANWALYSGYDRWLGNYDMGLFYTMTTMAAFGVWLHRIISAMVANITSSKAQVQNAASHGPGEASGAPGTTYAAELFCCVDFSCTDTEAMHVGIRAACSKMREKLLLESTVHRAQALSRAELLRQALRRAAGTAVSMVLVVAYLLTVFAASASGSALEDKPLSLPIFLAVLKMATPMAVRGLVKLEGYSHRGQQVVQEVPRIYVLKMTNLAIAVWGVRDTLASSACPVALVGVFWLRTYLVDVTLGAASMAVLSVVSWRASGKLLEADVSSPIIDVLYRQLMVLLGTFACPVLPIVFVACETAYFAIVAQVLHTFYRRPLVPFVLVDGPNFMLGLALITTCVGLCINVRLMQTESDGCGPHEEHVPLYIFVDVIRSSESTYPPVVKACVDFLLEQLSRPPLYAGVAAVLAFQLCLDRAGKEKLRRDVESLQEKLKAEQTMLLAVIDDHDIHL